MKSVLQRGNHPHSHIENYLHLHLHIYIYICACTCMHVRPPAAATPAGVTRRKLQTPGNAEEHKRQETPYNQPNRPNRQTSQTKHQALPKGQPGRRITPINTAAVRASAQQQPTISTHTRQGHHQIVSANAARCEAQEQYRRAG